MMVGLSTLSLCLALPRTVPAESVGHTHLQEGQDHLAEMLSASQGMVLHINRAATHGDLTEVRRHTEEAIRFGEAMVLHASEAMAHLQTIRAATDARSETGRSLYEAIFHLRMIVSHCQEALTLAKLSLTFQAIPSLLKGVQESAIHTRHAAMHAREGEHHLHNIKD